MAAEIKGNYRQSLDVPSRPNGAASSRVRRPFRSLRGWQSILEPIFDVTDSASIKTIGAEACPVAIHPQQGTTKTVAKTEQVPKPSNARSPRAQQTEDRTISFGRRFIGSFGPAIQMADRVLTDANDTFIVTGALAIEAVAASEVPEKEPRPRAGNGFTKFADAFMAVVKVQTKRLRRRHAEEEIVVPSPMDMESEDLKRGNDSILPVRNWELDVPEEDRVVFEDWMLFERELVESYTQGENEESVLDADRAGRT